jgi:subtilisin family serine protease
MNRWHILLIAVTVGFIFLAACGKSNKGVVVDPTVTGNSGGPTPLQFMPSTGTTPAALTDPNTGDNISAAQLNQMAQEIQGFDDALKKYNPNQNGAPQDEPFFHKRDKDAANKPDQWGLFQIGLTPDLLKRTLADLPESDGDRLAIVEHIQYAIARGSPKELERIAAALDDEKTLSPGSKAVLLGQLRDAKAGLRKPFLPARPLPDDVDKPLIVAVIDSGVDLTHPQLWGRLWRNPGEASGNGLDDDHNGFIDDVYGYNFVDSNGDIRDEHGHGTFVAGLIAARWDGRGLAGVDPKAKLMILKMIGGDGKVKALPLCRAIYYAVKHGAKIINMSVGLTPPGEPERVVIDWAIKQGALVVAASGTQGKDTATMTPASLPGVLTVGASDLKDNRAPFSGWGRHVALVAPGVDIVSLRAARSDFEGQANALEAAYRERWYRADGTSFSAPVVSGVAALIWAQHPKLTAEQVKRMLIMSCDDVDQPGWDVSTGAGRLNAANALKADPDHFLQAQITNVEPGRFEGERVVTVSGKAFGTHFKQRRLLIAFGKSPGKDDWKEVQLEKEAVTDGLLGRIPASKFNQKGVWSVRCIAEDDKGMKRLATVVVEIE